jgi:hypothetical protein
VSARHDADSGLHRPQPVGDLGVRLERIDRPAVDEPHGVEQLDGERFAGVRQRVRGHGSSLRA